MTLRADSAFSTRSVGSNSCMATGPPLDDMHASVFTPSTAHGPFGRTDAVQNI